MKLKHYDNFGHARFVTFCTHQRIPLLTNNLFRQELINSIKEKRRQTGFNLLAYVIMPEHLHLVIIPQLNTALGPLVGEIKRMSAKVILNHLRKAESKLLENLIATRNGRTRPVVWQRRCWDHNCHSDQSVMEKINYCHRNPVLRNLVKRETDWRWSSYRWYHGIDGVEIDMNLPKD